MAPLHLLLMDVDFGSQCTGRICTTKVSGSTSGGTSDLYTSIAQSQNISQPTEIMGGLMVGGGGFN